jgi:hypothetical protein
MTPKPIDELTFAARDAFVAAAAEADRLSRIGSGADADIAQTGDPTAEARARNTPVGAPMDLRGVHAPDTYQGGVPERLPNSPRSPTASANVDDGVRIDSAHSNLHAEAFVRYDAATHDRLAADHARSLAKSGTVPPTLDLGVPSTYRKD